MVNIIIVLILLLILGYALRGTIKHFKGEGACCGGGSGGGGRKASNLVICQEVIKKDFNENR